MIGNIKKSELLELGLRKKMIDKEEYYVNSYLKLKFVNKGVYKNLSKTFLKKENEIYTDESEVTKLIMYVGFLKKSEKFKNGLSSECRNQGDFDKVYKGVESDKDDNKLICRALFNYQISGSLMVTNGIYDNYNYRIIECYFEHKKSGNTKYVRFYYHYKDRLGHHDFWKTYEVFSGNDTVRGLCHPCYDYLTVKHFIDHFIPKNKMVIGELFRGTVGEIREYFNKKWCRVHNVDESKWNHIAPSSIDDIRIKNINTGLVMTFWAGSSGCNFMAVDSKGGCHKFVDSDEEIYEVIA